MSGLKLPKRYELSPEKRLEVLGILECKSDETLFMRIEEVISDYPNSKAILDNVPKVAATRDTFEQIRLAAKKGSKAKVEKYSKRLHRWVRIGDWLFRSNNLDELAEQADVLAGICDSEDVKTPRRTDQIRRARDFAIIELIDIYRNYSSRQAKHTRGYLGPVMNDKQWLAGLERFISVVVGYGEIPCPPMTPKDRQHNDKEQSRLRRLLKQLLEDSTPQ